MRGWELATKEEAEGGGSGRPPAAVPRASGPSRWPPGTAAPGPGPGAHAGGLNPFGPAGVRRRGAAGSWHLPVGGVGGDRVLSAPRAGGLRRIALRTAGRRVGRENRRPRPPKGPPSRPAGHERRSAGREGRGRRGPRSAARRPPSPQPHAHARETELCERPFESHSLSD